MGAEPGSEVGAGVLVAVDSGVLLGIVVGVLLSRGASSLPAEAELSLVLAPLAAKAVCVATVLKIDSMGSSVGLSTTAVEAERVQAPSNKAKNTRIAIRSFFFFIYARFLRAFVGY